MPYIDQHTHQHAFVGNQMARLLDLIDQQSIQFLGDADITLPSRAVSTIILMNEYGQISTADIAKELKQPHQLATQRVEVLIDLGLVNRITDPKDGRRKILTLTTQGRKEAEKLNARLATAAQIFLGINKEIGCDLSRAILAAMDALTHSPMAERAKTIENNK